MKQLLLTYCILCFGFHIQAQKFSVSIGSDIPYNHYIGTTLETKNIDFSYQTGILVPPYSGAVLGIIEKLGADEIYTDLLDVAYDFGWMNSLGAYYKFGAQKKWYVGADFRLDYLTAADSSNELIATLTGIDLSILDGFITDGIAVKLRLKMFGIGARVGRSFSISKNNKHHIKTEFSIGKYLSTKSTLTLNGEDFESLNEALDRALWDDVFKKYGYIGGFGIAYSYTF